MWASKVLYGLLFLLSLFAAFTPLADTNKPASALFVEPNDYGQFRTITGYDGVQKDCRLNFTFRTLTTRGAPTSIFFYRFGALYKCLERVD